MSDSLWPLGPTMLLRPWDFPGKNTGEWVAISFSRRSSWPRDWTQVSRIVGRCFTIWATREVLQEVKFRLIPWRLASLERSEDLRRCPQILCLSVNYSWKVWTPTSSHLLEEWVFSSALVKDFQLKVWDLFQRLRPSSARSLRSALGYRRWEESCSHGNPASSAGTSIKVVPSILGKSK